MKSFLLLFLTLVVSTTSKSESKWVPYSGTSLESDKDLTQLCMDYMKRGFLENQVDYYLSLVPPYGKSMEKSILKAFAKKRLKKFGDAPNPQYKFLKMDEIMHQVHKGREITRIMISYQGGTAKRATYSSCYFQKIDGRRYLGSIP